MQEIILAGDPVVVAFCRDDGSAIHLNYPCYATRDATLLREWLYGKSEKTQVAYTSDINRLYAFTRVSLQELTLGDFQNFADSIMHLQPSSRARIIASIKSVLSFGAKMKYLPFNIGAAMKLPKLEDKLAERILSEHQIAKMFALEENPRNHAILILLYRAGLRAEELCNLTWRNFQQRDESGQVTVFGKGKKTRHVLLDQDTWQDVMALRKDTSALSDYVFESRQASSRAGKDDLRMDESTIYRIVMVAASRAGIKTSEGSHVSPHWMRHAHATHSLEHGAPITLVKETLGHKSMETTAKYTHVRPNASSATFLKV